MGCPQGAGLRRSAQAGASTSRMAARQVGLARRARRTDDRAIHGSPDITVQHRKEREGPFTRLVLTGRLTGQDADAVRGLIVGIKTDADRRFLLDLTGLTFIDSAGVGMLLVLNGEALATGKSLATLTGQGQVKRVLDLTRIAMIVPDFATMEAYVAACVPEAALAPAHPCAPGEDPLAVAARALSLSPAE